MRPIIGTTCQYRESDGFKMIEVNSDYTRAIEKAGAIPLIIPLLEDKAQLVKYMDLIDGLLLTGGADIAPLRYGEDPINAIEAIATERDNQELELIKVALEKDIPMLGICRGLQIINVALGGSLYQDIPSQRPESIAHRSMSTLRHGFHTIEAEEASFLKEIYGDQELLVNSAHHQGIKDLGENLKVAAKARDGMIEAIESSNEKVIYAVQFHPEMQIVNNNEFLKIFDYFVGKCKK